jgi:hypothetical protein
MLDVKAFEAKAKELILKFAKEAIPGPEKMAAVVDKIAEWADTEIKWGFLGPIGPMVEAVDGIVIKKLIELPLQLVYNKLKEQGEV